MESRLNVVLVPGWTDCSKENPDGPSTFVRESGALQISTHALYASGDIPNPSPEQLIAYAEQIVERQEGAEIRGRAAGECAFGHYGTVLAYVDNYDWFQVWMISNGKDFIVASHICADEPSEEEVSEAGWIVKNVTLNP